MIPDSAAAFGPQPVPIIDMRSANVDQKFNEAVKSGYPIVLTGPPAKNLVEFAQGWFPTGAFDCDEFAASCGTAKAPVCRVGYTGNQLESGEKMHVKLFVNLHWPDSHGIYLAQWQFPTHVIEEKDEMNDSWRLSSVPEEIMGVDFFSLAHQGFNPYQYLFMGGASTQSKIHNDLGGFSILLTTLVGIKDVLMVHRDDEHLLYGMTRNLEELDRDKYPLAATARVWRHVVVPGDVLLLVSANPFPQKIANTRCTASPNNSSSYKPHALLVVF